MNSNFLISDDNIDWNGLGARNEIFGKNFELPSWLFSFTRAESHFRYFHSGFNAIEVAKQIQLIGTREQMISDRHNLVSVTRLSFPDRLSCLNSLLNGRFLEKPQARCKVRLANRNTEL